MHRAHVRVLCECAGTLFSVADALDGRTVQWEFESQDGQTANAVVAGENFALDQNGVFILRTTASRSEVSFIPRELTALVFDNESVEAFIQSDDDLSGYLQALITP